MTAKTTSPPSIATMHALSTSSSTLNPSSVTYYAAYNPRATIHSCVPGEDGYIVCNPTTAGRGFVVHCTPGRSCCPRSASSAGRALWVEPPERGAIWWRLGQHIDLQTETALSTAEAAALRRQE
ncbi:hypothetical protein ON010_g18781 [Phytophthora cinnamomi]|nr:hypothetical protein ON010_g18781 [Phytophthora cinnamomi]